MILPGGQHQPWLHPQILQAAAPQLVPPTSGLESTLPSTPAAQSVYCNLAPSTNGLAATARDILGHKTSLHKFKKIIITQRIIYDHKGIRLEINYKEKKSEKIINTWMLNKIPLTKPTNVSLKKSKRKQKNIQR